MKHKYLIAVVAFLIIAGSSFAQNEKLGYGFRAGASISTFNGPSETGPNGESLESWSNAKGFHIGAAVSYKVTDLFGARMEFVFSQRGTIYDYKGPSYYVLGRGNVLTTTIGGTRTQTLNVSNAYIDLPLMVYYKIGMFELSGGLNSALLIASTAGGSTDFEGKSALGTTVAPFEVGLNHNYKKDEAGGASEETISVNVDGRNYAVPETVMAYYEFPVKDKNQYKTLDFGIVGCVSIFLNEGLFFSARYVHGLGDVDENLYDVSLQSLNPDGSFIQRADKNTSRSWQFSVGFSF
ncbi:MAG: PorT family protein [Saprospiraceae bacterium]|nr:PorT family protein [Saprospiraceae bacterium]